MNAKTIETLQAVVKGTVPADKAIINGKIINVFTDSIEEGYAILIKDGWIASVEKNTGNDGPLVPNALEIIDAGGNYLCPGFIDAHTHVDGQYSFSEFVPYAIRGGTTTVVTETSAVTCSAGIKGLTALMEMTKGHPLRAYFTAPPLTPPFPDMERSLGLDLREFLAILKREDVLGIGEAYWTPVLGGNKKFLPKAIMALGLNKRLEGHAAGARGKRLVEYALTGITSCHESVTVDEAMEKLKLGMYVMVREGSIRQELPELSKIRAFGVDMRRLILVSDFFAAAMLVEEGYLDSLARRAVSYGFTPIEAIKMLTINPSDYFGLRYLGAIAPLRFADILFLSDIDKITIEKVIAGGHIVFEKGEYKNKPGPREYPEQLKKTITIGRCKDDDFKVASRGKESIVRVIDIVNPTITKEFRASLSVKNGFIEKDIHSDILPIAMINKRKQGAIGRGFVRGTGIKNGAVALTLTWDTGNILVMGSSEENMAQAANRIIDIQGGVVIVKDGSIIYEFPMELFGIMSTAPMEEVAGKIKGFESKMAEIGSKMTKPFLNIQTIPFTGLPFLRITDKGLVDVKQKKLVPLVIKH